jgi:hypothetical protein
MKGIIEKNRKDNLQSSALVKEFTAQTYEEFKQTQLNMTNTTAERV